jgi:hypothetical protein
MKIDWELVVESIKALAWPVFAAFALYLLRRPLVDLVAQIARRARKLSVFEVSVELATLPELQPSWSAGNADPRRLTSSMIFDSASASLFQELAKPNQAEYAIVDLRSGNAWLTSRLFIFAVILGEVTGLRAFVFLENAAGIRRRFLCVATPANVRKALGRRYPWLEEAFAKALIKHYYYNLVMPPVPAVPLAAGIAPAPAAAPAPPPPKFTNLASPFAADPYGNNASNFVRRFIEELQQKTIPPESEINSYLKIETETDTWERTRWIDGEHLERDLSGVLEFAWVEDSPDIARSTVSESVSRRNASFVALVDSDRRFISLVDRYALLGEMSSIKNSVKNKVDQPD